MNLIQETNFILKKYKDKGFKVIDSLDKLIEGKCGENCTWNYDISSNKRVYSFLFNSTGQVRPSNLSLQKNLL